jgi:hypothetical protein
VTTTDGAGPRDLRESAGTAPDATAARGCFEPDLVADLPEAARRWLCHAIAVGTPLWSTAELEMHGLIRLGRWRYFTAQQSITPPGRFLWAAQTRVAGLPLGGYDRFADGSGESRWRLLGVVPVISTAGPDIARSAAGRLAAEAVLVPTAFASATWHGCADPDRVRAVWAVGELELQVQLHIGHHGELLEISMLRWGNPGGAPYGAYPFGAVVEQERRFDGITIPSRFRASWWWDTDRQARGEFFRAQVTSARFTR